MKTAAIIGVLVLAGPAAAHAQYAPPPTEFHIVEAAESTVTLAWVDPDMVSMTDPDGTKGTVDSYLLHYLERQPGDPPAWSEGEWALAISVGEVPLPVQPGTDQQCVVSSLEGGTWYSFAIRSVYAGVTGPAIYCAGWTVADDDPPQAISGLGVAALSESSLRVTWTAPDEDRTRLMGGSASEYDLRIVIVPEGGLPPLLDNASWGQGTRILAGMPAYPAAPGMAQSADISGLEEGRRYVVAIRAKDSSSWGDASSNAVGSTGENDGGGGSSVEGSACGFSAGPAAGLLPLLLLAGRPRRR